MKKFHFIGIGGIGLSALARYLKKRNHQISGSDIKETHITKMLEDEGIEVTIPHDEKAIKDQDFIVYSAAIKNDNIELCRAKERGLKILSRKDVLSIILKDKKVFAVGGAHGKSTTSAMLASLIDASVVIGAESKQFGSNMFFKDGTDEVVFEADESDASFLNSNPYLATVTNAEPEHMEYYDYDIDRFHDAYRKFLQRAKIRVINDEDEFLSTLDMESIKLYPSRDIKDIKSVIKDSEPYTSFALKDFGTFEVWGLGEHIALDASLSILAASTQMDIEDIRRRIKDYRGIKKRFDILFSNDDAVLIDDYGHHPTEIEATMRSAKEYAKMLGIKKVTAIWQPHKYSRTISNLEGFKKCFKGVDSLIILPVWKAGEETVEIDFCEHFKRYDPVFVDSLSRKDKKIELIRDSKGVKILDEGLIIGFGAGNITYQLRGI